MKPIDTLHLFEDLNQELIYFLAELTNEEWMLPSPLAGRTIKDLAAHLVDGSMRRISLQRDHYVDMNDPSPDTHPELVNWIQRKNVQWIEAFRRLSPRIIVEMLKKYEQEVFELYSRLKPEDPSVFAVSWAGQKVSPNWFDIARDYTEKWHHQMQMRMAAGKELLMSERFLTPVYETLLLGLPHHLNQLVPGLKDHVLEIDITNHIRLRNRLIYSDKGWVFSDDLSSPVSTKMMIPAAVGWMLFTNTVRDKQQYADKVEVNGNEAVANAVLHLVSVMS